MNKTRVDQNIPKAIQAIEDCGIAENNVIKKTYRGQVSTLGAAISGGSLLAAAAFFSDKGSASIDRTNISRAIYQIITGTKSEEKDALFQYIKKNIASEGEPKLKEEVYDAAVALKLAMNVYTLEKEK